MYCSVCGFIIQAALQTTCCPSCGKKIKFFITVVKPQESNVGITDIKYKEFLEKRSDENLTVTIFVGLMHDKDSTLKPLRGSVMPLKVPQNCNAEYLLKAAVQKMQDFNEKLHGDDYLLLFPDGTRITNIPGAETPFTLKAYKEALGKPYQRITVYLCTAQDFNMYSQDTSIKCEDSEVIIRSRTTSEFNAAQTLVWELHMNSTTEDVEKAPAGSTSPMLDFETKPDPSKQREPESHNKSIEVFAPLVVADVDIKSEVDFCEPSNDKRNQREFGSNSTKRDTEALVRAVERADVTCEDVSDQTEVCSRHSVSGKPAYGMMENDPDRAPSLLLNYEAQQSKDALKPKRSYKKRLNRTEADKERPCAPPWRDLKLRPQSPVADDILQPFEEFFRNALTDALDSCLDAGTRPSSNQSADRLQSCANCVRLEERILELEEKLATPHPILEQWMEPLSPNSDGSEPTSPL